MVAWIVFCTIWFNFVLGALIPITPKLNEPMAGVAFSSFVFMKILVFIPAGWISDRIGHFTGFFIGLCGQVLTLILILLFPDLVWVARSAEGITLAFGTVSALSLFRLYAKDNKDFGKSISMMMGIGSAGFLLGPFFGYMVKTEIALWGLFIVSAIVAASHWTLISLHRKACAHGVLLSEEQGNNVTAWAILLCFALVKGLGVGTQPLVGWWATNTIGLTTSMAGFSFVSASIGFMLANYKPAWYRALFGLIGLVSLEFALSGYHFMWWPGLLCLGLFSGTMINLSLSKLGWNKPENIGLKNSKLLALSDIPMMVTPALLWQLREPGQWTARFPLLIGTMLVVLFLMRPQRWRRS